MLSPVGDARWLDYESARNVASIDQLLELQTRRHENLPVRHFDDLQTAQEVQNPFRLV